MVVIWFILSYEYTYIVECAYVGYKSFLFLIYGGNNIVNLDKMLEDEDM